MFVAGILMLIGVISFTQFKKTCFLFFTLIPKQKAVKNFWDKYEGRVHSWFKDKKRYAVVISASPDFLLNEIAQRLGFDKLICTQHNYKTGIIIGENCRDEEKVRRLYNEFDKDSIKVVDVYSDSIKHDRPIFSLAENQCYHIVDGEKQPFKFEDVYKS
jgi:phosphoserine phosphatase